MSKIAEALAKAKERTGTTTAPFLVGKSGLPGLPPPQPGNKDALLRKARRTQLFWLVLTSVASLITTFLIWQRLTPDEPRASAAAPLPAPVSSPAPTSAVSPALALPPPKPDPAATTITPAPGTQPAPAPVPVRVVPPSAELYNTVNTLVISAVLPGAQPRLMHKGRIVHIGEPVEGELIFAGIQDGQLVFNDRRGAIYVRRY